MKPTKSPYPSIIVMALGFLAFYFIFDKIFLLGISTAILVVSLASEKGARLIEKGWLKFGLALGFINSRIILWVVYYVVLTPMALLGRLFGKDELQLKKGKDNSYYAERNHTYVAKDFTKPF